MFTQINEHLKEQETNDSMPDRYGVMRSKIDFTKRML